MYLRTYYVVQWQLILKEKLLQILLFPSFLLNITLISGRFFSALTKSSIFENFSFWSFEVQIVIKIFLWGILKDIVFGLQAI